MKKSFKGWNIKEFLKGRRKLISVSIGFIGSWLITQDPLISGFVGAGTEFILAGYDYYMKK